MGAYDLRTTTVSAATSREGSKAIYDIDILDAFMGGTKDSVAILDWRSIRRKFENLYG